MVIPERVKIGALTYSVRLVDDLRDGSAELRGWHLLKEQGEIQLRSGMDDDSMAVVFWHEVLHSVLHQTGHDTDDDEAIINAIAHSFVQIFQANGWTIQL